ncbi:hypothetical protein FEM48_Zijuj06G0213300 [Ziziphus jujuba var. spinosa]|uniref:Uncharacterized protein n=1 Tax=Ziziphus jujuba var. spinosa TaxID=714518 RepID=A0A978VBP5_ZIZJJ|nr:hypothetical protein FEM48_Zijuj06G0213300 [Ziziphus jujuba var. spinosa]
MSFFPSLKNLEIRECPKLTSMPLFPYLEWLSPEQTSSKPLLQMMTMTMAQKEASSSSSSSASSSSSFQPLSKLVDMQIQSIDDVQSLLQQALGNLSSLRSLNSQKCANLTSLPEAMGNLSSLGYIENRNCPNLTSLGLQHSKEIGLPGNLKCEAISAMKALLVFGAGLAADNGAVGFTFSLMIVIDNLEKEIYLITSKCTRNCVCVFSFMQRCLVSTGFTELIVYSFLDSILLSFSGQSQFVDWLCILKSLLHVDLLMKSQAQSSNQLIICKALQLSSLHQFQTQ